MIQIKGKLNKKEEFKVNTLIQEINDYYGDFYITKNNLRLFIKENIHLLYDCLNQGDKIAYGDKEGIVFITGFSDNSIRKYIKILAVDNASANKLLKNLLWNTECDLWAKIKKNNPINKILQNNNFKFAGARGKEILLKRKFIRTNITLDNKSQEGE